MKIDMEAMMGKVREELAPGSFGQSDPLLQNALVAKSGRINELEQKVRGLEDKVVQVSAERDKLIQISSELRAELNR